MKTFFPYLLLICLITIFSCNKENSDIVRVQVLNKGVPVPNYGVALTGGVNSVGWAETSKHGIAAIDLQGAVLGEPDSYVLLTTSGRSIGGYTIYKGVQEFHTINIEEEEVLEVKVLSPSDIENTVYNFGDVIDIQLKMTSNQTLLNYRNKTITQLGGSYSGIEYEKDINNRPLNDTDVNGIINFKYTVTEVLYNKESEAGFVVGFENKDGDWVQYFFYIKAE